MSRVVRSFLVLCLLLSAGASVARAQDAALVRAFNLERRGDYDAAGKAYREILSSTPDDVAALLGLERVLTNQNRVAELVPAVQAALATDPRASAIYSLGIRAWSAAGQPDSVEKVVDRWVAIQPNDESPYREWALQALARRDRQEARRILMLAREKLHRPTALAGEMAQLSMAELDYPGAVREWAAAVRAFPGYRAAAINALAVVPVRVRGQVIDELTAGSEPAGPQIAAVLQARWGSPMAAWALLDGSLPARPEQALDVLGALRDAVSGLAGSDARRAEGHVLEAMADRSPPGRAASLRLEAARAYAAGGDSESARRELGQAGAAVADSQQLAAEAGVTLVRVLLDEGKVRDAAQELARYRNALPGGIVQELSRQVATAWVAKGELDRADSLVAQDSTVEGLALRGRLFLYRGELGEARKALQSAGPYAGTRDEVTSRTTILALLQSLESDHDPALGQAFLTLARGDTMSAVNAFTSVGGRLPAGSGGAEVTLLAGRLAAASGHGDRAEPLLRRAAAADSSSAAPAAMFELARVLVGLQRASEAVPVLESLILNRPESAVVPQARRLLDELRGAVPKT